MANTVVRWQWLKSEYLLEHSDSLRTVLTFCDPLLRTIFTLPLFLTAVWTKARLCFPSTAHPLLPITILSFWDIVCNPIGSLAISDHPNPSFTVARGIQGTLAYGGPGRLRVVHMPTHSDRGS